MVLIHCHFSVGHGYDLSDNSVIAFLKHRLLSAVFTLTGRLVVVMVGGGGYRGGIPQLATESVEPKPDADILPRHRKSFIASVSSVRASAIGSS